MTDRSWTLAARIEYFRGGAKPTTTGVDGWNAERFVWLVTNGRPVREEGRRLSCSAGSCGIVCLDSIHLGAGQPFQRWGTACPLSDASAASQRTSRLVFCRVSEK
ncbi:MAG: hypothetical protein ACYSWU_08970, partial [Planctomycetota bacterium]